MRSKGRPFGVWRAMSPTESIRLAYRTLDQVNDPALLISIKPEEDALAEALQAASANLPLSGLPFVVKDNIDVAGMDTTAACPAFAYRAAQSAFAVARLQAAGAVCIGKANLDQFATGLVGVRSPYGVPRNALDPELVPGGSSSGSAVAVAQGICAFALGTDTAGSGRIPAGMNGIVGLKPTLGMLSATGVVPACRTLDTISVFAASVADAVRVAAIAQGVDAADFMSRSLPKADAIAMPPHISVGVPRDDQRHFFGDADARRAYEADLQRLTALGASIHEIDFDPLFAVARLLYEGPWVAERYHAIRNMMENQPGALHPVTRQIIEGARGFSAVDTFDATYRYRTLKASVQPVLDGVDCLAVPTVPRMYSVAELEAEPVQLNSNLGTYTNFVNLLDLAAISVPCGTRGDGLPSSLTLIGRAGSDARLAGYALTLEQGQRGEDKNGIPEDHIPLAVVGAHLSGMPLNRELTSRGARFVGANETSADYRLYALSGTAPKKPGLLRVAPGTGRSIEVEVWALTPGAFGSFVAGIPAPLGIGTLSLADGSQVQGFLVEAEAVRTARDISDYGSWRTFMAENAAAS